MGGARSSHGRDENAYTFFIGKPEKKRLLGRPRRRWEDNIRMDLREIGWEVVDWIHLAQYKEQWRAVVNMVMNLRNYFVS
jgi:ribosome biogenesis protein Nip4